MKACKWAQTFDTCLLGVQTYRQIVKYLNTKYSAVKDCRDCTYDTFWSIAGLLQTGIGNCKEKLT